MWELCNERVCREFEWAVKGESFFVKAPIWSAKRRVIPWKAVGVPEADGSESRRLTPITGLRRPRWPSGFAIFQEGFSSLAM